MYFKLKFVYTLENKFSKPTRKERNFFRRIAKNPYSGKDAIIKSFSYEISRKKRKINLQILRFLFFY